MFFSLKIVCLLCFPGCPKYYFCTLVSGKLTVMCIGVILSLFLSLFMFYLFPEPKVNWAKWNSSFHLTWLHTTLFPPVLFKSFFCTYKSQMGTPFQKTMANLVDCGGSFTLVKVFFACWLVFIPLSPHAPPWDSFSTLSACSVPWKADFCAFHALVFLLTGFWMGLINGMFRQEIGGQETGVVSRRYSLSYLHCLGKVLIVAASMTTASVGSWLP